MKEAKIRLYVDHPLGVGQSISVSKEQAHYLFGVMRLGVGSGVLLFNGQDGEYLCKIEHAAKRSGVLVCKSQTKLLEMPPDLWLLFAPIKKSRTDFIVEKAVEMGVARIVPVVTDHTNSERIRRDRLQAHAVEAAEQCGATYVPEVAELQKLSKVLDDWPNNRKLMFCDEAAENGSTLQGAKGPWGIVIGPEGGFSERERTRLQAFDAATSVSLGPRILRADTAAVAALAIWQTSLGDWQ